MKGDNDYDLKSAHRQAESDRATPSMSRSRVSGLCVRDRRTAIIDNRNSYYIYIDCWMIPGCPVPHINEKGTR